MNPLFNLALATLLFGSLSTLAKDNATNTKNSAKTKVRGPLKKVDDSNPLLKWSDRYFLPRYGKMQLLPKGARQKFLQQLRSEFDKFSPEIKKQLSLIDTGIGSCHKKGGLECTQVFFEPGQCLLKSIENKTPCNDRSKPLAFNSNPASTVPMLHWEKLRRQLTLTCKNKKLLKADKNSCATLRKMALPKVALKDVGKGP